MKPVDKLLDLLYPPRCPFCHRFTDVAFEICQHCERNLPYVPVGCLDRASFQVDEFYSALYYKDVVRDCIHRYKFASLAMYAECCARLMCRCVEDNELEADVVAWVPLSARRLRRRGFDQARLLAERVAEYMELPCMPLLEKQRDNIAQSSTSSAEERRENVRGVYRCRADASVDGARILLVDDVVTTGATLEECAKTLKRAGAKKILALTLACTMD